MNLKMLMIEIYRLHFLILLYTVTLLEPGSFITSIVKSNNIFLVTPSES